MLKYRNVACPAQTKVEKSVMPERRAYPSEEPAYEKMQTAFQPNERLNLMPLRAGVPPACAGRGERA